MACCRASSASSFLGRGNVSLMLQEVSFLNCVHSLSDPSLLVPIRGDIWALTGSNDSCRLFKNPPHLHCEGFFGMGAGMAYCQLGTDFVCLEFMGCFEKTIAILSTSSWSSKHCCSFFTVTQLYTKTFGLRLRKISLPPPRSLFLLSFSKLHNAVH